MKKFNTSLLVFSCALLFVFSSGCGTTPEEVMQRYKDEKIAVSGLHLDKDVLNDYYKELGNPVTTEQLLSSIMDKKKSDTKVDDIDVVVDMSAGMNIGIDKSYKAITAVMSRFNPQSQHVKYYHVDDDATNMQPLSEIKSLSDASVLQNPANYKKSFSKLKPAFESASKSGNKISLIITDFLLDEGVKSDKRLKNGKYTKDETADNSTWAVPYFTKWFAGQNQILVYPYQYSAKNYYNKQETKYIYYILFIPKGCVNSNLESLKTDFASIFTQPVDFNTTAYSFHFNTNEKELPGDCVANYSTIKDQGNKAKVFADYNTLFIPYSHKGIIKNNYLGKPITCGLSIENKTPFNLNLTTSSYDMTNVYYRALAMSNDEWSKSENAKESYLKGKAENKDLVCDIASDYSLSFKLNDNVGKENYLSKNKGYANLLLSRILIGSMKVKDIDTQLSWDFESKYGTMENNALGESIRLSLDTYVASTKNVPLGAIFFSLHDK